MLKKDVFDHFELASNVARALGVPVSQVKASAVKSNVARILNLSHTAILKWGDVVPWFSAVELERITKRALRVDRSLYDARGRPIQALAAVNQ